MAGVLFLLVVFVGGIVAMLSDSEEKPKPAKTPEEIARETRIDAEAGCRAMILRQLHDPDSAKFEAALSVFEKNNIWTMTIPTRAKNAFGAYRVADFRCEILRQGETWLPVKLTQQ
jgi:hypothetical protein